LRVTLVGGHGPPCWLDAARPLRVPEIGAFLRTGSTQPRSRSIGAAELSGNPLGASIKRFLLPDQHNGVPSDALPLVPWTTGANAQDRVDSRCTIRHGKR